MLTIIHCVPCDVSSSPERARTCLACRDVTDPGSRSLHPRTTSSTDSLTLLTRYAETGPTMELAKLSSRASADLLDVVHEHVCLGSKVLTARSQPSLARSCIAQTHHANGVVKIDLRAGLALRGLVYAWQHAAHVALLPAIVKHSRDAPHSAASDCLQVLHTVSINVSPEMRRMLVNPTLNGKFEDIANGRSNTLAAGLTQLLHDWEYLFRCEPLELSSASCFACADTASFMCLALCAFDCASNPPEHASGLSESTDTTRRNRAYVAR